MNTVRSLSRCNTLTCKSCTQKPKNNSCGTSSYWSRVSYCFLFIWRGGNTSETQGINQRFVKLIDELNLIFITTWSIPSPVWEPPGPSRAFSIKTDVTAYWGIHTQEYTSGTSTKASRTRNTQGMSPQMHIHTHGSWQTAGGEAHLTKIIGIFNRDINEQ